MAQTALKLVDPDGEWLSIQQIAKRCDIHRHTCTTRLEDLGYEADEDRSSLKNRVYWFDDEMEQAVNGIKKWLGSLFGKKRQL